MIIDRICSYLANPKEISVQSLSKIASLGAFNFARQFGAQEESERGLRLSSIGHCKRKQAYNLLGYEVNGKEIDPRAKMVFYQGDMAELAIVNLASLAGCRIESFGDGQRTVEINGVKGHPDGILKDYQGDYLLEVKSMSSYSFADFERGEIDEGYLYQINAYMHALGLKKAIVVALNKDAGIMSERSLTINKDIVIDILSTIEELKELSSLSKPVESILPARKFSPNEKGIYPWNCLYCAHWKTCHPEAQTVLIGKSNKLVDTKTYKAKEVKDV